VAQRLFAAIVPPGAAIEDLRRAVAAVRDDAAGAGLRWTAVEQWHVTLVFCALVKDDGVAPLRDGLEQVAAAVAPFPLRVAGAGAFPRERRARVLWAGLEPPPPRELREGVLPMEGPPREVRGEAVLAGLAADARSAARGAGIPVPDAPFRGHLTLARVAPPGDVSATVAALAAYRGPAWTVAQVVLLRSRLGAGPGGRARHEVVDRFPLAAR